MQAESRIGNLCDLALAAQYLPALLATWLLIGDVISQPVSTLKGGGTLFSRSKLVRTEPTETAAGIHIFFFDHVDSRCYGIQEGVVERGRKWMQRC